MYIFRGGYGFRTDYVDPCLTSYMLHRISNSAGMYCRYNILPFHNHSPELSLSPKPHGPKEYRTTFQNSGILVSSRNTEPQNFLN
jgi:hypothetical protein